MRLISARSWALVVFSSVLQTLAFPLAGPLPAARSAVCWICLTPLLMALFLPDRSAKSLNAARSFVLGYLCGFLWYLLNCYWIFQTMFLYGGLSKPVSAAILILFSLYLGLYHALFSVLICWTRKLFAGKSWPLLLTPFLWVAVELMRGRVTGFPWDLLGYAQIDNALLTRLAPFAGVMSLSFIIAAVNAAVALPFLGSQSRRNYGIAAAALVIALASQGIARLLPVTNEPANYTMVSMQENLEVGAQGREVTPLSNSEEFDQFTRWSEYPEISDGSRGGNLFVPSTKKIDRPTVIVWPEAPAHFRSDDPNLRAVLGNLARTTHAPLIIGTLGVDVTAAAPRGYYVYDSAALFDAAGGYKGRYDKIHLVPWGEYIPFKRFFAFAEKLTEGAGDMDFGWDRKVFSTGDHTYGIFVCYESIFGNEVRQFAKNGAEVLVNISDDGWYGDTGAPWQHLNMARMRAIENHRWVLRSTNTGVTTAIDPYGRPQLQAPRHVRGAYVFPFGFEPANELTFYTRYGDWFAWLCTIITATLAVLALIKKTPLLQQSSS